MQPERCTSPQAFLRHQAYHVTLKYQRERASAVAVTAVLAQIILKGKQEGKQPSRGHAHLLETNTTTEVRLLDTTPAVNTLNNSQI